LGTSFNIDANKKNNTEVTVATGKVSVNNKHKKSVIITPGFSAKVTNKGVEKFETKKANYLSWKTGKFIFKEADLRQVVSDLNSFYKTKFVINDETKRCKFTSEFNNLKIEEIAEILQLSCNVTIKKKQDTYIIY
jgi:ferric-dicitrate binding protein FerR (iron transport regulator)